MSEGLEFTQKALEDNDVTTTLSVLELIDTTIIETSATIPSENKSNMDEINLKRYFQKNNQKIYQKYLKIKLKNKSRNNKTNFKY